MLRKITPAGSNENDAQDDRIRGEIKTLQGDPIDGIKIEPNPNIVRHYYLRIKGPPGSPYEEGNFDFEMFLPVEYPRKAPTLIWNTKIYHPNVSSKGLV